MGTVFSHYISDPATIPDYTKEPTFDPLYGFGEGRKERVMIATKEEMDSAKIPLENRDYCAHILIKHMACRDKVWPLTYKCAHEKHEYLNCQYDDYVLRMKEHERERRLLERAKRKAAKAALEQLEEE
ncbi:NADH dehydrogenase [ubiquinone] 1 beta subcomplex subunit 7 isoform X1 [Palaemon carinicauda]|uniref:NADH dehydrogenase [ubiquinone] 1 beta subcomplex subunit 7 isoform X1 n=1 Tax=Palaemon carinicauda TaxID=392227 RepID=UPI0035B5E2BD